MRPLLTICIPTYNRAALLEEALKSVIDDGLLDSGFNMVVCDNASPDDTEDRVKRFREMGAPITYHRQPKNLGYSLNVVEAARQADGEYIWFFGDDDLIAPGTLGRVLETLADARPQIIYLNHQGFSLENRGWGKKPAHPEVDETFHDGTRFFSAAGLGFLSALILRRDEFLKHAPKVIPSRNNAQIETAARIALGGKGPFLLLGTVSVRARIDANGGGNILVDGFVHPCEIYRELVDEGLLTEDFLREWKHRSLIREIFPRSLFYLCKGSEQKFYGAFQRLKSSFGDDPAFPWTTGMLAKIPLFLLKPPYLVLHLLVSRLRLPLFRLVKAISRKNRK